MKWKPADLILIVTVLLVIAGLFAPAVDSWWREHRLTRQFGPLQSALESYRQRHGAYPESLSAASIPAPEEISYDRQPDGTFTLGFGMELGESVTLHSNDRKVRR